MRRPGSRRQASVDYPRYPPLNSTTQQPYIQPDSIAQNMLVSDYDSDNQGYVSDYPGLLVPTPRSKDELNVSVLRKWNPEVVRIMSIAPYATLYEFATGANEWQKTGLVGTLFICELSRGRYGEERYQAIVLNRGGLENYEAELRQSERGGVSMTGDYVEITKDDPETGGIKANALFIYSEEGTSTAGSREGNGQLMVALANAAKTSRDAAEAQYLQPVQPVQPVHTVQTEPHPSYYNSQPQPEIRPDYTHFPQQPSPAPPVAPSPARPVDLLALFRGHQSDAESAVSRPAEVRPAEPRPEVNLLDLFRKSGAL